MSTTREFLLERPSYLARILLYTFGGFIVSLLIVSWFATINITAIGKGIISTENDPKEIYVSNNGVLINIFVSRGQSVKKGQILATFSSDESAQSNGAISSIELSKSNAEQELRLLDASTRASIEAAKQNLSRATEQEKLSGNLYSEGFITKIDYLKAKDSLSNAKANYENTLIETAKKRNDAKSKLLACANDYNTQQRKISMSNARRGDFDAKKDGYDAIYAPCDGIVALAQSWGVGTMVKSSSPAFVVVPSGEKLVAKIEIPSSQMTNVKVGENVQLEIDAYPFQQFGIWRGTVGYISAASKTNPKGESFYEANVVIDQADAKIKSKPLIVGQTLLAQIVVQQKRVFIYIIDYIRGLSKSQ